MVFPIGPDARACSSCDTSVVSPALSGLPGGEAPRWGTGMGRRMWRPSFPAEPRPGLRPQEAARLHGRRSTLSLTFSSAWQAVVKNRLGKGAGYAHWAKLYNLKQMAAALQFLQENGLTDYDELAAKPETAVDRVHTLSDELREMEARLATTSALMGAVVDYAKTRPVFDGYKASRYSRKYLAEHEAELDTYRAAKASINEILNGGKLPKMDALKKERRELAEKKKSLYGEYRQAQKEMREFVTVKGNIDHLLSVTESRDDKEQAR